jgi:hypothetical protein
VDVKTLVEQLGGTAIDSDTRALLEQGLSRMSQQQLARYERDVTALQESMPRSLATLYELRSRRLAAQNEAFQDPEVAALALLAAALARIASLESALVRQEKALEKVGLEVAKARREHIERASEAEARIRVLEGEVEAFQRRLREAAAQPARQAAVQPAREPAAQPPRVRVRAGIE